MVPAQAVGVQEFDAGNSALGLQLFDLVVQPSDLLSFFGWIALALPVYLVPCWALALSAAERALVQDAVRRRLQFGLA